MRSAPGVGGTFPIQIGNPGGSLEATRRSFNKDFLLALAADFKKHGAAAIEKVRKQQPAAYMKICALLVPRELQVEHSGGIKAMTDEQIERSISRRCWRSARPTRMPRSSKGLPSRCQPSRLHRVRQGARCEGATEPTGALRLGLLNAEPTDECASRPEVRSAPRKVLEPVGRHVGVPNRMLDVPVPEVVL